MIHPKKTKIALLAGAATAALMAPQVHAQSSDALIDKLVEKGILTVKEAQDLRNESDQDFKTAFQSMTGMPDWVKGYNLTGDFRGRYEQYTTASPGGPPSGFGNYYIPASGMDHIRLRYRLRFGVTVNMTDNLEAGFRLGSGDPKGGNSGGTPLSNSSTFQQSFDKKPVYVDTAYGKWTLGTPGDWTLSTTIGKMDTPFDFTPMVFDQDLTPEGAAVQSTYNLNRKQSLTFNAGAFVLNDSYNPSFNADIVNNTYYTTGTSESPFLYGGQVLWRSKWTPKWSSSVGIGAFEIVNARQLGAGVTNTVPLTNLGNSRDVNGNLLYGFSPIIEDASVTYTCSTFPFYDGAFPIKLQGEMMNNPAAPANNNGYWGGITFGKSGTKHTWDLSYRYEYLESDAWYDQLVDDDNTAFYPYTPSYQWYNNYNLIYTPVTGIPAGYVGGTNIKGHLIRFNYSVTDAFTISLTCYLNSLVIPGPMGILSAGEPKSTAMHFMADANWKF